MGPLARPLAFDFYLCRFMPRPCISVRSGGLLRLLQRATFSARRKFSASQARSQMQYHDGMHLLYQGMNTCQPLGAGGMLLHGEANTPVIRASLDTLSPRHARHPIQWHEAANYLYNRYRYL